MPDRNLVPLPEPENLFGSFGLRDLLRVFFVTALLLSLHRVFNIAFLPLVLGTIYFLAELTLWKANSVILVAFAITGVVVYLVLLLLWYMASPPSAFEGTGLDLRLISFQQKDSTLSLGIARGQFVWTPAEISSLYAPVATAVWLASIVGGIYSAFWLERETLGTLAVTFSVLCLLLALFGS